MVDMNDLEDEFDAILAETRRRYFSDYDLEGEDRPSVMTDEESAKSAGSGEAGETGDASSSALEQLRTLYERNSILVDRLREMNMETTSQMRDTMQEISLLLDRGQAQERTDLSREEMRDKILDSIEESQRQISQLLAKSDDFSHKESVRVYKNIQASTAQELEKRNALLTAQIAELKEEIGRRDSEAAQAASKAGKLQLILLILILIAALGILGLLLLRTFGLL